MKRVLTVVTCVLAFGAAASVASASTTALPSCSHCGYVSAHGTGTITENAADGLSYGTVTSGSIAIRGKAHGRWVDEEEVGPQPRRSEFFSAKAYHRIESVCEGRRDQLCCFPFPRV